MLSTTKAMIGPYSRLSIREMRGKIVYSSTRRCRRGVNTTRTKGGVFATSRCFAGSQAPVRAVPSPHRREHATNGRGMSRWGALGVATTGSALAMLTVTRNPDDQLRTVPEGTTTEEYTMTTNKWSVERVQGRRRARGPDAKVKMLILMSDTGGGHRASAQALETALEELFPDRIEVVTVDMLAEHAHWPLSLSVPVYQFTAKNPLLWRAVFEFTRFPLTRYVLGELLMFQNFACFREAMQRYSPDIVVSVHPLCQDLPLKVLESMGPGRARDVPFVTVVTDLGGAHPTWFNKKVDKVFVASDAVKGVAFDEGVRAAQIHQLGLPTRPAFWKDPRPRAELRKELGLRNDSPVAMVMGGGDGVGDLGAIARSVADALAEKLDQSQVVVICGKNQALKRELEEAKWPENARVLIHGFVSNMHEWMEAVDTLVTKAGPGTIAEATIKGLPVMLSGFLPGQEEGNVPYVVNGGFGAFSKEPREIGATVARWLQDPELLQKMRANALRAARPRASYDIAREIADMIFLESQTPGSVDP